MQKETFAETAMLHPLSQQAAPCTGKTGAHSALPRSDDSNVNTRAVPVLFGG